MKKFFGWIARLIGLNRNPQVAVVRLNGVIGGSGGLRPGLSLAGVAGQLEDAFDTSRLKAVALQINSPGGSPVQSRLIHDRVRVLSEEKGVPVFAFCEDVAASGGYMLAVSADEIFADQSSIVGSIGVISAGFGFPGLLEKLGVERRVHTSGENKATLDPFSPEKQEDVDRILSLQAEVHEGFKDLVRERRGTRLKEDDNPTVFTGEFWAGTKAHEMGLIDGLGDLRSVMRKRYGSKVKMKLVSAEKGLLRRARMDANINANPLADLFGAPGQALAWLETRSFWSRFGL